MGYRLRLTSLVLAGCLAASWDSWAQTGLVPTDVAALNSEHLSLCIENLSPDSVIPLPHPVGCERWDCCAQCPGPPDWRVDVGPAAEELFLRFQNLSPEARKNLLVKGPASWEKDGQLKLGPGETRISRFRPDKVGRWPVAFASVALIKQRLDHPPAVSQGDQKSPQPQEPKATRPIRWPQQIAFSIRQFSGTAMAGGTNVTIYTQACRPAGGGTGPTAPGAIAVLNEAAASVTVYNLPIDPNLGGGVAPVREIRGPHTQFLAPVKVAVDGAGQIYVMNLRRDPLNEHDFETVQDTVTVYARGASGDAAPIRTITSSVLDFVPDTESTPSLAVDEAGEIFIATTRAGSLLPPTNLGSVAFFPAGTQGVAVPAQTITDGIFFPEGLAVSRDGNFLYVVNSGLDGGVGPTITVYHRAFGFFSLVQTIPPPGNLRSIWRSIAVDRAGLIYAGPALVGVPEVGNVFVFQRDANGTYANAGQFSGFNLFNVFFSDSSAIAADPGGFVYVTEAGSGGGLDAVRVFGPNPRGLSPIIATIAGPASGLAFPFAIAIIP